MIHTLLLAFRSERTKYCLLFIGILIGTGTIGNAKETHPILARIISVTYQNQSLSTVLSDLTFRHRIPLSYSNDRMPMKEKVNLSIREGTVESLLNQLSAALSITYEVMGGQVVLLPEIPLPETAIVTQTIRGQVRDKDTQVPLVGATVIVMGTVPLKGANTDAKGYFKIAQVPVGRQTIQASYIGYQKLTRQGISVNSGNEPTLALELTESVLSANEVVITPQRNQDQPINESAVISTHSFSVEETQRYAAGLSDPARMATVFAGVYGGDDLRNELIVRGNSPRGLLWRLEGVEIPNPNHFAKEGTSSGSISVLSSHVLSDADFITGAFPAQYGNAYSGVFDLNMRKGNDSRHEFGFQMGLLGLEATAEGPFSKKYKGSFLVNYRYSSLALLEGIFDTRFIRKDYTNYQDLAFKLDFPTKRGRLSVFGVSGRSHLTQGQDSLGEQFTGSMGVLGVSNRMAFGRTAYMKSVYSLSGTAISSQLSGQSFNPDFRKEEELEKGYFRASWSIHKKFGPRHVTEFGFIYSHQFYNFQGQTFDPRQPAPWNNYKHFDAQGDGRIIQSYIDWKLRISDDIQLVSGLHYTHHDLNNGTALEPRVGFRWNYAPRQSLRLGLGMHNRQESLEYFLVQLPDSTQPNRLIDMPRARHAIIGYHLHMTTNLYLKVEAYFQYLFQLPVGLDSTKSYFSTIAVRDGYSSDKLVNLGTGRNYGIELTLRKYFANDYYFMLTTSAYQAYYQGRNQVELNSPFNGNFGVCVSWWQRISNGQKGETPYIWGSWSLYASRQ